MTVDQKYINKIKRIKDPAKLLDAIMENPDYLSDHYYRDFGNAMKYAYDKIKERKNIMPTQKERKVMQKTLAQIRKIKERRLLNEVIYIEIDDIEENQSGEYFTTLDGIDNGARIAVFKLDHIGTADVHLIKTQKIVKDKE